MFRSFYGKQYLIEFSIFVKHASAVVGLARTAERI